MSMQTQAAYTGNLSSWMAGLDSTLTMVQLSVPGTHDSGTHKVAPGPYHTQNFGISTQLGDGIRFLDIRLASSSSKDDPLQVNHGKVSCDLSFGHVLNQCSAFLSANSGEVIFMLVNDAYGNPTSLTVYDGFQTYLANGAYQNLFCLSSACAQLPLSQLRGKIVLLRRFFAPEGAELGLNLQQQGDTFDNTGWPDNYSASFSTATPPPSPQTSLFIEDQYNTHDTGAKMKAVTAALDAAKANPGDAILRLCFNSIAWHTPHTPYDYAWSLSGAMNPALQGYLAQNPGKARFGFVMLDFYNNSTGHLDNSNVATLVNSNFS